MTRKILGLAAVLLAVVVLSSVAQAAPFGLAEDQAYEEAKAWWGRDPIPTLCTSVEKELFPPGTITDDQGSVDGQATAPGAGLPLGFYPVAAPCVLRIAEGLAPDRLCTVMRHEFGHLLGYEHSDPELANMPPCESQTPSASEEAEAERRRASWTNWRERREWCQRLHREQKWKWQEHYCWNRLRRSRLRIETYWRELPQ